MKPTDMKELLKTLFDKLRQYDGSLHLSRYIAVFAVSTVLGMLGIDASDLFDDKS